MVSIWMDLSSSSCLLSWWCVQKEREPQGWGLWLGLGSSRSGDDFCPSRANHWGKPLMASGPSTCPYFFQLECVYVYVSFACSTWEHFTLSWRFDVNKRTNQKTNRQHTAPRLKQHLQHKNTRQLPHTSSHPPHQWQHPALALSKHQHPGARQKKFLTL